jgi:hypothetical protein
MGIPHATVVRLATEGITSVIDLADFDKESLQQLADNLRRPGRVPDPNPAAQPGATIATPSFILGTKSQQRLTVTTDPFKYYATTGRELTVANIRWTLVTKNFEVQWKAVKEKKEEDTPDVPKITKTLPVITWTETFTDFLDRVIGVRTIPLYYVIREEVQVPAETPPLATDQSHSTEHSSVEKELIARSSHQHPLFRGDNANVYHYLHQTLPTYQGWQKRLNGTSHPICWHRQVGG